MGRGRTKGNKLSATTQEDAGSGEEEKVPPQKRRGRPQKSIKDTVDEDEVQKIEDGDSEDTSAKTGTAKDGNKRRRSSQAEKAIDSMKEDNPNGNRPSIGESIRSTGFRQNGNRRKNKPRRAAEAVVECN